MKKLIVMAIAMALSAPVWAAPQEPQQPASSAEVAGPAARDVSSINTAAWVYSGIAAAAVAYAIVGDSSGSENDSGSSTTGTTGTTGTSGTTGTGG